MNSCRNMFMAFVTAVIIKTFKRRLDVACAAIHYMTRRSMSDIQSVLECDDKGSTWAVKEMLIVLGNVDLWRNIVKTRNVSIQDSFSRMLSDIIITTENMNPDYVTNYRKLAFSLFDKVIASHFSFSQ